MFVFDERLGIRIPDLQINFEDLPQSEQEQILVEWQLIRAQIPDQIARFEEKIQLLLNEIQEEEDWDAIVSRFDTISRHASCIAELNGWQRIDPSLSSSSHPHGGRPVNPS